MDEELRISSPASGITAGFWCNIGYRVYFIFLAGLGTFWRTAMSTATVYDNEAIRSSTFSPAMKINDPVALYYRLLYGYHILI
jgi:hypothetical protein